MLLLVLCFPVFLSLFFCHSRIRGECRGGGIIRAYLKILFRSEIQDLQPNFEIGSNEFVELGFFPRYNGFS